eukprot:1187099-Prorocentrum_minimum.AAC.3
MWKRSDWQVLPHQRPHLIGEVSHNAPTNARMVPVMLPVMFPVRIPPIRVSSSVGGLSQKVAHRRDGSNNTKRVARAILPGSWRRMSSSGASVPPFRILHKERECCPPFMELT